MNASVLIVDDEPNIRQIIRYLLEGDDFGPVWEAGDAETALALAGRYQPNLILLDYMMPRMNGERVAEHIRTLAPRARILAFSALLDDCPDWADGFVHKTDVTGLVDTLKQQVGEIARAKPNQADDGGASLRGGRQRSSG